MPGSDLLTRCRYELKLSDFRKRFKTCKEFRQWAVGQMLVLKDTCKSFLSDLPC